MTKTEANQALRRRGLTWLSDHYRIVDTLAGHMFARSSRTLDAWHECWTAAEALVSRWGV